MITIATESHDGFNHELCLIRVVDLGMFDNLLEG